MSITNIKLFSKRYDMEILDELVDYIRQYNEEAELNSYQLVLILSSATFITFYVLRWFKYRHVSHISSLVTVLISMNLWNIVLAFCSERFVMNLNRLCDLYQAMKENGDFNHTMSHILASHNTGIALKDIKFLLVMIVSYIMFEFLSKHAITTIKIANTQYNSDLEQNYTKRPAIIKENSRLKKAMNFIAIYACVLSVCVLVIPECLLLNSSAKVYSHIKFDHLFWSMNITYFLTNIHRLYQNMNCSPESANFFSIVSYFSWLYDGLIVGIFTVSMILFNDILMNYLLLMINAASGNNQFKDYNINIFTAVLMDFLTQSSSTECLHKLCTTAHKVQLMAREFVWFQNLFSNCATVLSLSGFAVIPLVIWVVVVECKFVHFTK